MSETVRSFGLMAVLSKPVSKADYEDQSDALYDKDQQLHLNYEGTLIYSDLKTCNTDIYGITFGGSKVDDSDFMAFIEKCRTAGYEVDIGTIRSYSCIWYNWADSDMSMLTKDKFLSA